MTKIKTLLAGLCALVVLLAPARAADVRVINALDDFRTFRSQAQGKGFAEQERLWTAFEAKYPDVYQRIAFPRSDPGWEERRLAKLREAFARLPAAGGAIEAMMEGAEALAQRQAAAFRKTFPDLPADMLVVFVPIATFNAAVRPAETMSVYGRAALVIGVDYVLDNRDVVDSLFAHEFFHVYHFGKLAGRPSNSTMASPLWIEGLATYVSAVMNPAVAPASILLDPALAEACTPANVRAWAKDYQQMLGQDASSPALQRAWFRSVSDAKPRRRGYCLGFHVARVLARGNSLQEMAAWDETVYQPRIAAALSELAD